MLNTAQLRQVWGPPCHITPARVVLYGGAPITVDYRAKEAFAALSRCLERHQYPAPRTDPATTGAYVCRAITGGTGYSLHAFGIAVDIRWGENPYQTPRQYAHGLTTTMPPAMVDEILGLRTNNGKQLFGWGGNYSVNKDPMHFEIVCTPADLATGIADHQPTPTKPDPARPQEDDDMPPPSIVQAGPAGAKQGPVYLVYPSGLAVHLKEPADIDSARFLGATDHLDVDGTPFLSLVTPVEPVL